MKKVLFYLALVASIFSFNACDIPGIGSLSGVSEIVESQ